jgi:hypothetical protein
MEGGARVSTLDLIVVVGALLFIAYKLGVANERLRHAPGPPELAEDLKRAAATREWTTR